MWKLLKAREITRSPFSSRIKTNEPAHWVRPDLVAQVRFTEWTADDKLRHPVYLGLRDDKRAADVVREEPARESAVQPAVQTRRSTAIERPAAPDAAQRALMRPSVARRRQLHGARGRAARRRRSTLPDGDRARRHQPREGVLAGRRSSPKATCSATTRKSSPLILPAVADRPLVMKRFPNGVGGRRSISSARAWRSRRPASASKRFPRGLDPISEPDARRFVGGIADHAALHDADRGDLAGPVVLARAVAARRRLRRARSRSRRRHAVRARARRRALGARRARVAARARRAEDVRLERPAHLHAASARARRTNPAAVLPDRRHRRSRRAIRKVATVERTVRARPRGTVYVDFLQNILGKTLATAYSARASDFAGVSTPLTWEELDETIDPQDFTIRTAPARFREVGDLWARLRTTKPANLEAVFRKYQAREGSGGAARSRPRSSAPTPARPRARTGVRSTACAWRARAGRRSNPRSGSTGRRHRRRSRRAADRSAALQPPHSNATTCMPARRAASTSYGVSPSITACSGAQSVVFSAAWTMSGSGFDSTHRPTTFAFGMRSWTPARSSSGSSSSALAELATASVKPSSAERCEQFARRGETGGAVAATALEHLAAARGMLPALRGILLDAGDGRHELVAAHADRAAYLIVRNRDPVFGERVDPRARVGVVAVDERAVHVEDHGCVVRRPSSDAASLPLRRPRRLRGRRLRRNLRLRLRQFLGLFAAADQIVVGRIALLRRAGLRSCLAMDAPFADALTSSKAGATAAISSRDGKAHRTSRPRKRPGRSASEG